MRTKPSVVTHLGRLEREPLSLFVGSERRTRGKVQRRLCVFATGLTGALVGLMPSAAQANAGLPMIVVAWPMMSLMLGPVIALESIMLKRALGISWRRSAVVVSVSNVLSTLLGVPLTWGLLVGLQVLSGATTVGPSLDTTAGKIFAATVQAPWLLPYESEEHWLLPAAMLFLLVPFFFASWAVEYLVSRQLVRDLSQRTLKLAVMKANLASYALLVLFAAAALGIGLLSSPHLPARG